jgi:hypothetical protein
MRSYYTQGVASYYKSGYAPLPLVIAAGGPPPIRAMKGLGLTYTYTGPYQVQSEDQLLASAPSAWGGTISTLPVYSAQPGLTPPGVAQSYTPQDLASMVASGAPLTATQAAQWNALSAATRSALLAPYAALAASGGTGSGVVSSPGLVTGAAGQVTAIAAGAAPAVGATVAGASWLDKSTTILGTVIKNSYLAAGLGIGALALIVGKKKR